MEVAASSDVRIQNVLGRLEMILDNENNRIGVDPSFDLKASNARKSRCLYELTMLHRDASPSRDFAVLRLADAAHQNQADGQFAEGERAYGSLPVGGGNPQDRRAGRRCGRHLFGAAVPVRRFLMLKLVFTGVWVCAVALGSVYFSIQHASAPVESDAEAERRALQQYVPGELITVPVITDGAVQGYFLTKLSFAVDKNKIKHLDVPFKETVTNALFDILVGQKLINVADTNSFDLANFKTRSRKG